MIPDGFNGFPPLASNATNIPNQFFELVLRYASRGTVRLVAYMLRRSLGWSDAQGHPWEPEVTATYRELEQSAGIGHSSIGTAIAEAVHARYVRCLRPGRPDGRGQTAVSAAYELCWDERDDYLTDPEAFCGFYAGSGHFTPAPNAFFDVTIPREPLAVIQVVGTILRHTLGWQTRYGFRRQEVAMSFSELARRTGIASRRSLNAALQQALAHRYLVRVQAGCFDPKAARESRPATYAICWQDGFTGRLTRSGAPWEGEETKGSAAVRTESDNRPLRLGDREHSEKETDKEKVLLSPLSKQQQLPPRSLVRTSEPTREEPPAPPAAAAVTGGEGARSEPAPPALSRLMAEGFEAETAAALVSRYPAEQILRQCDWLPRRAARQNRLGLLRRAIEGDWPEPRGAPDSREGSPVRTSEPNTTATEPAMLFAAHAYAGWAGNDGAPTATPSAGEIDASRRLLARLRELSPGADQPPQWGRQFGDYVRRREGQGGDERFRLRTLAAALRTYGDAFCREVAARKRKLREAQLRRGRERHEERFRPAYLGYLREQADSLRREAPELLKRFETAEAERVQRMEQTVAKSPELRTVLRGALADPGEQLRRLAAFSRDHGKQKLLDFWRWDRHCNPQAFDPKRG